MAKITKILDSDLPSNIVLSEKGMKTKKIYFRNNGDDINNFYYIGLGNTAILGYNEKEKICLFVDYPEKIFADIYVKLYENNNQISSTSIGMSKGNSSYGRPSGTFCVEFNSPITIESSGISVYCIPEKTIELKPMPKIDKLIDSSSFENVSAKLQEINNLLKVSSNNLKTIMDANNLMYEPTDNFSTLVQKLNSEPYSMLIDGTSFQKKILQIMDNIEMADYFTIYFLDSSKVENNSIPSSAVDVSKKQDGSIKMYTSTKVPIIKNSEKFIDYESKIYIISDKKIMANEDCSNMFAIHYHIDNIYFYNFNTSKTINMSNMFDDISSQYCMTTLNNTENFNTNSALNMDNMFKNAVSISGEITISNTNISYNNIFTNCSTSSHDNLILNYINEETKALAEQMIATKSPNSKIKLGTLVTQ